MNLQSPIMRSPAVASTFVFYNIDNSVSLVTFQIPGPATNLYRLRVMLPSVVTFQVLSFCENDPVYIAFPLH